jgi:hypothetical protein
MCCARFPLHNLLPTTILPVCLFSGFPSGTGQSVSGFTIWGNTPWSARRRRHPK